MNFHVFPDDLPGMPPDRDIEFINRGFCMAHNGMLWFLTNACDMNECEAPESKRTVAGVELTLNVPSMTSDLASAVSVDTWFTFPVLGAGF